MHIRASQIAHPGTLSREWRTRVVVMLVALLVLAAAISLYFVVSDDDGSSTSTVTPAVQSTVTGGPNETARGLSAAGQEAFSTAPQTGGPDEAARGNAAAGN